MSIGHAILRDREVILVDLMTWANWLEENQGAGIVEKTELGGGVRISTVFMGIDHSMGGESPLWFETMISGGPLDQSQWRYNNWKQAEKGHRFAVAEAKGAKAPVSD